MTGVSMCRKSIVSLLILGLGGLLVAPVSADWPRFRGENGTGIATDAGSLPTKWSPTENLKWKVALPGPGSSSPIVVGDKVFVTCWSGYGTDRQAPGDQSQLRRHLVCLDRETGTTLWDKSIEPVLPEDDYRGMFTQHGYASHTPTSDGQRVYAYFGKTGAMAFDMDGNVLWQTKLGTESDPRGWGSASSPILYKNLVIVTASAESEALVALDKETGGEVWRQEAAGFSGTWGTPILVPVDDQRTDLVIGVPFEIWALNPDTGKLQWYCEAMDTDSFCSSVVTDGGVIYAIEGRNGGSIALRAGGKDDVTKSHVVWTGRHTNRIATPLVVDGRIYFFANGVANCLDTATAKEIYKARLGGSDTDVQGSSQAASGPRGSAGPARRGRGGPMSGDYASPILADGKIYYVARSGMVYVLKPGDQFEQLAVNRMTSDTEDFSATPAADDGSLFFRSDKHLYCVSTKQ